MKLPKSHSVLVQRKAFLVELDFLIIQPRLENEPGQIAQISKAYQSHENMRFPFRNRGPLGEKLRNASTFWLNVARSISGEEFATQAHQSPNIRAEITSWRWPIYIVG